MLGDPATLPGPPSGCPGVYWEVWLPVWVTSLQHHLSGSPGLQALKLSVWVTEMGAGYWKEECQEISSDNALLGSQRNLKDPLSRQTKANKLQSFQKFILELWVDSSDLEA